MRNFHPLPPADFNRRFLPVPYFFILTGKDLTTIDGLTGTLEFEILDDQGIIKSTWMEYIARAFPQINDQNAKNIVLHLCKHKGEEVTRKDLMDTLHLDMTDEVLEGKLNALVKSDIIEQGVSNFRYHAVADNIFDKVFRGVYQDEIEHFDVGQIKKEYGQSFEKLKRRYQRLQGVEINHLTPSFFFSVAYSNLRLSI